jgi:hypothetical protein
LKRAFKKPGMKPHAAPASTPASIIAGMNTHGEVSGGRIGINTTALAPNAPMKNCPSAPMFHSFIRNATEQARPTRISGVALTMVSEKTPRLPNDAEAMCA